MPSPPKSPTSRPVQHKGDLLSDIAGDPFATDPSLQRDLLLYRGYLRIVQVLSILFVVMGVALLLATFLASALSTYMILYLVLSLLLMVAGGLLGLLGRRSRRFPSERLAWITVTVVLGALSLVFLVSLLLALSLTPQGTDLFEPLRFLFLILFTVLLFSLAAGATAISRIKVKTGEPETSDFRAQYFPLIAQLIMRTINSDGAANDEELAHFDMVLDAVHLAPIQKELLRSYCDESTTPLTDIVDKALRYGKAMGQPDPAAALINGLVAAAKADGPINDDEWNFIEMVGQIAKMDTAHLYHHLNE